MEINRKETQILIVDDEDGMRDLLSFELRSQGYNMDCAVSGIDALKKLEERKFDLVITDIRMPGMDGFVFLKELKKIAPDVEVIMVTGFGTVEMAVTAMKEGAYDFVQKPFNLSEICALVDKALEKKELKTLVTLYESSMAIFSTIKLQVLLDIVMGIVQKVLKADEASLMFLDEKKKLYIAASYGLSEEVVAKVHLDIGGRVAGLVYKDRMGRLLINELNNYPEFLGIEPNPRIGSAIVIPLLFRDEIFGVLNAARFKGGDNLDSSDFYKASIFSSQIAQAVKNIQLYEALEKKVEELKKAYQVLDQDKDRLIESEKLTAIGRLAAGVAHEINNPLMTILGYLEMLLTYSELNEEARKDIEVVHSEAQRCKGIIQNLLIFANRRKPVPELVNIEKVVEEILAALLLDFIENHIRVEKCYNLCPAIMIDLFQIKQVLLSVIKNAINSVKDIQPDRQVTVSIFTVSERDVAQIVISNNGPGIKAENLDKIFDPFFTIKEISERAGLGLSLSYSIVKELGGNIIVNSEEGKGASFIIELPISGKIV